ncbi:hypothetical protein KAR91_51835 [Candidatus Pacearchaeota archaeon]|nr:hypothetical protein [Candidatus Pacearchaeota archaeon]
MARTENEIRSIFRATYKGNNFMTPEIVRFGNAGKYIYELSSSGKTQGFAANLHGVTVLNSATQEKENDLNQSFHSLADAEAYIEGLSE